MMKVMEQVLKVSRFDITVHITGETGSGKEVVAKAISGISPRRDGKFVKINCGAISEDLIDSELFGHLKGSFTGAEADRKGLFEEANGGTLFLDEVGELSNAAQIKLLRAIETKTIRPVGGREDVHVDIRVISATHCSLSERVKEGRFREDLYYRLNVFTIEVPPLRQRKGDIESIATILLKDAHLSPEALTLLKNHDWPGNIRQLKNILEAASIVAKEGRIQAGDIHLFDEEDEETSAFQTLEDLGAEKARDHILKAIEVANGNKTKAAKILGISRASLYEKIKAYNIQ
jgi:transcriptional regulator with PAS, ATPase and Fis domain